MGIQNRDSSELGLLQLEVGNNGFAKVLGFVVQCLFKLKGFCLKLQSSSKSKYLFIGNLVLSILL